MHDTIAQLFAQLDCWRHLPNYQLERRFDIFLTPYLKRIVEPAVNLALGPIIVPEMPLKQVETNRSDKADYVLFSEEAHAAILVELKTDCGSIRDGQVDYLLRAAGTPWKQTLQNLMSVVLATTYRRKYIHLLRLLERAGQVRLDPRIHDCFRAGGRAIFRPEWVAVTTEVTRVIPVFITPRAISGLSCVTFADIRAALRIPDDPLASLLVRYLKKWECDAGSVAPEQEASGV